MRCPSTLPSVCSGSFFPVFLVIKNDSFIIVVCQKLNEIIYMEKIGQKKVSFVSVILAVLNEKAHIEKAIRSIASQDPPPDGFEIVVADGMSSDGTRDILNKLCKEMADLRVIDNPGRIVSTGLNAALAVAKGAIIIRMDAHTVYAKDYVCQCLVVRNETKADNVGGAVVGDGDGMISRSISAAFQSSFAVGGSNGYDPNFEGEVSTVYLGCWARDFFEQVGKFDEKFVRNQDDEFNLRSKLADAKIWQSSRIRSWYKPRNSLKAAFWHYAQYGYWKVRVLKKHKQLSSIRPLIPSVFVLLLLILPLLGVWWGAALFMWGIMVGTYGVANMTFSLRASSATEWTLFPFIFLVFGCFHIGYGFGFLRGLVDFLLFQKEPGYSFTKVTRPVARC